MFRRCHSVCISPLEFLFESEAAAIAGPALCGTHAPAKAGLTRIRDRSSPIGIFPHWERNADGEQGMAEQAQPQQAPTPGEGTFSAEPKQHLAQTPEYEISIRNTY
jgi:hypothetical protein